ncbi:hypothetical protein [Lactovum odontotermitis]
MQTRAFDDFLAEYTRDPERKASVEQFGEELDELVLHNEIREFEEKETHHV